jgi:hypothetical protein
MKWIKLDEALPENDTLCWVNLAGEDPLLCLYANDSFGLGDDDFKILAWKEARVILNRPKEDRYCSPESTSQEPDHTYADSSRSSGHPAL